MSASMRAGTRMADAATVRSSARFLVCGAGDGCGVCVGVLCFARWWVRAEIVSCLRVQDTSFTRRSEVWSRCADVETIRRSRCCEVHLTERMALAPSLHVQFPTQL